jgi:hypothetical protein
MVGRGFFCDTPELRIVYFSFAEQIRPWTIAMASDPVLDILADVLQNEVKWISQTAVLIQEATPNTASDALELCGTVTSFNKRT